MSALHYLSGNLLILSMSFSPVEWWLPRVSSSASIWYLFDTLIPLSWSLLFYSSQSHVLAPHRVLLEKSAMLLSFHRIQQPMSSHRPHAQVPIAYWNLSVRMTWWVVLSSQCLLVLDLYFQTWHRYLRTLLELAFALAYVVHKLHHTCNMRPSKLFLTIYWWRRTATARFLH